MRQPGLFDDATPCGNRQGSIKIIFKPTFESFRDAARQALKSELKPESIWWVEDTAVVTSAISDDAINVPREYVSLAKFAACHRAPDRWALLYEVIWRLKHGEPYLLSLGGDPLITRLHKYDKSVHRDFHKAKAFVRFKKIMEPDSERFVAWFEPEHYIIELTAHFFAKRFTNMRWSLLSPMGCAHWDGSGQPLITEGLTEAEVHNDDLDQLWRTYYRHIFNPARVKTEAMRAEMPQKYWKHLPEAEVISDLLIHADERVDQMIRSDHKPADLRCGERPAPYSLLLEEKIIASDEPVDQIAAGVRACQNCSLWQVATQAVPGEGPIDARVMIIGEQPGDQEDLAGRPFVGPAGQLLDELLYEIGVDRADLYLTNAVKHFKFRATPKRRLHEKPREGEINACRQWLMNEIEAVNPELIICLGVTAASAVIERRVELKALQGRIYDLGRYRLMATWHPSAVLRATHPYNIRQRLKDDLRLALDSIDHNPADHKSTDADLP